MEDVSKIFLLVETRIILDINNKDRILFREYLGEKFRYYRHCYILVKRGMLHQVCKWWGGLTLCFERDNSKFYLASLEDRG